MNQIHNTIEKFFFENYTYLLHFRVTQKTNIVLILKIFYAKFIRVHREEM